MITDSQGRRLWIADEQGSIAPVNSHADIQSRRRGGGEADWWVVARDREWSPPTRKSFLNSGASGASSGNGGGTKIGGGGKPQPYGAHGWYGSTGSASSTGPAHRGKVTQPNEVRGKASPRPFAKVTWKNDDRTRPDPKQDDLKPEMQDAVARIKEEVPKLDTVNMNSGRRPFDPANPNDPHADGRAVDINNINGVRVVNLETATGPEAERAREAAANLEKWAKVDDDIKQFIGPNGGWTRDRSGNPYPINPNDPKGRKLLDEHKNHYHIGM
jgi:hypothetical protein